MWRFNFPPVIPYSESFISKFPDSEDEEEGEDEEEETRDRKKFSSYEDMTVAELKILCGERSLTKSGTKTEIIERLEFNDKKKEPKKKKNSNNSSYDTSSSRDFFYNFYEDYSFSEEDEEDEEEEIRDRKNSSSYEDMTVAELKILCGERSLTKSGNKTEIIERLEFNDKKKEPKKKKNSNNSSKNGLTRSSSSFDIQQDGFYDVLNVEELKKLCEKRELKKGGNRGEIIKRLEEFDREKIRKRSQKLNYGELNVEQLKLLCEKKGLKKSGKRQELLERLEEYKMCKKKSKKEEPDSSTPYGEFTLDELKDICVKKELPKKGTKQELLDRLKQHTSSNKKRSSSSQSLEEPKKKKIKVEKEVKKEEKEEEEYSDSSEMDLSEMELSETELSEMIDRRKHKANFFSKFPIKSSGEKLKTCTSSKKSSLPLISVLVYDELNDTNYEFILQTVDELFTQVKNSTKEEDFRLVYFSPKFNRETTVHSTTNLEDEMVLTMKRSNQPPLLSKFTNTQILLSSLKDEKNLRIIPMLCFSDIISSLGSGTYATVEKRNLKIPDEQPIPVAVKRLKSTEEGKIQLNREYEVLRSKSSPRLLQLIGKVEEDKTKDYWLITHLQDGGNLGNRIHMPEKQKLTDAIKLRFSLEIAEGLYSLHKANPKAIIHRDLKPSNILLTSRDLNEAHIVICDFGQSRVLNSAFDATVSTQGTYPYMAPECLRDDKTSSTPSDIFSLGTVLYELWTLKRPYGGEKCPIKISKILKRDKNPGNPSHISHPVIRTIVTECWNENPFSRPKSEKIFTKLLDITKDDLKDENGKGWIQDWVKNRVETSQTLYTVRGKKDTLTALRLVSLLQKNLKTLLCCFSSRQISLIQKSIDEGSYIMYFKEDSEFKSLEHPGLSKDTESCIYLWRNSKTGKGYVGQTTRKRTKRDKEHEDSHKSLFEKDLLANRKDWDVITLCQNKKSDQLDQLEALCVLLFNTSARRENPMGFNLEIGGKWVGDNWIKGNDNHPIHSII